MEFVPLQVLHIKSGKDWHCTSLEDVNARRALNDAKP